MTNGPSLNTRRDKPVIPPNLSDGQISHGSFQRPWTAHTTLHGLECHQREYAYIEWSECHMHARARARNPPNSYTSNAIHPTITTRDPLISKHPSNCGEATSITRESIYQALTKAGIENLQSQELLTTAMIGMTGIQHNAKYTTRHMRSLLSRFQTAQVRMVRMTTSMLERKITWDRNMAYLPLNSFRKH